MTWKRFQFVMICLMCTLITAEVWRFCVQWNWHAFIDTVLVANFVADKIYVWRQAKLREVAA